MKHLTLLFAFAAAAALAQPAITLSGSISGATAKVDIKLASSGTQPTALQFDLKVPPGAVIAQGPALPAGTRLYSNTVEGVTTAIIAGSRVAISDGVIATITYPAASFTFSPSGYLAVDVTPTVLSTAAIPAFTLTLPSPCDLNGDGVVDSLDVRNAADQADHVFACGNADLNSDGFCNSIDVQLVVNAAATGGACKTTGK